MIRKGFATDYGCKCSEYFINLQTKVDKIFTLKHILTGWLFYTLYMWKKYSIWIISSVSLAFSVTAVCVAVWRSPELSFDYQGVIVGVLSLLVTVLVGLNIYALVDFKRKESLVDDKIRLMTESLSNLSKSELATGATTENAIASLYYSAMGLKDPLGLEYRYIYHSLISIAKVSQLGDVDTCNAIVKALLESIVAPENISMKKMNKEQLYIWINQIKNPTKINGFGELVERIARISTR